MSVHIISELGEKLQREQTLLNWLQVYAALIWTKIGFAKSHPPLRIHETTITQNFVFDCWLIAKTSSWGIKVYESLDEKANGSDLELVVETTKGYMIFAAQAKIIKKGYIYPSVKHTVRGISQIDLLIQYARRKCGLPVYLFYNYCGDQKINQEVEDESGMPVESYGMSLCSAVYLKENYFAPKWKTPRFSELHPRHSFPLHALGEPDLYDWDSYRCKDGEIRYYNFEEIDRDTHFTDLTPPPKIGYIPGKEREEALALLQANSRPVFNPKFRVMFSFEKQKTKIHFLS